MKKLLLALIFLALVSCIQKMSYDCSHEKEMNFAFKVNHKYSLIQDIYISNNRYMSPRKSDGDLMIPTGTTIEIKNLYWSSIFNRVFPTALIISSEKTELIGIEFTMMNFWETSLNCDQIQNLPNEHHIKKSIKNKEWFWLTIKDYFKEEKDF